MAAASQTYKKSLGMVHVGALVRKNMIVLCALIGAFLAFLYAFTSPVSYTAQSQISFSSAQSGSVADTSSNVNIYDIQAQIMMIQSSEVIQKVIADGDYALTVNEFQDRLNVRLIGGTALVDISFQANDPDRAADIVNNVIAHYKARAEIKREEGFQAAVQTMAERLDVLRQNIRQTENKFRDNLERVDQSDNQQNDAALDRIQNLTSDLESLKDSLRETESILQRLDEAIRDEGFLKNVPYYADTPVFDDLRLIEAELDATEASLNGQDVQGNAEYETLQNEMNAFREVLNKEIADYIEILKTKRSIEKAEIRQTEEQLNNLREEYRNNDGGQAAFKNLLDEADTSRALLETLNARYQDEIRNLNDQVLNINVVARAVPPQNPDPRHILLIIGAGCLAGLIVGYVMAMMAEYFSHTVKRPRHLEKITGFPVYGVLPKVKQKNIEKPYAFILKNPSSMAVESVRSLYANLQVRDNNKRGGTRIVTVTSTYSDEGKSTAAVWLATIAAQNGKKTLIIDADMRAPSIHKAYDIGNAKGLVDFLSDRLPLEETIYKNHSSGVHIMTGKAIPNYAVMLLAHARMENMIRRLSDMYDMIIIDAPASLLFSDSRLLTRFSDKILYLAEWNRVDYPNLTTSLKQFSDMNFNDIAFVMNKLDRKYGMTYSKALQKDLEYFNNSKTK